MQRVRRKSLKHPLRFRGSFGLRGSIGFRSSLSFLGSLGFRGSLGLAAALVIAGASPCSAGSLQFHETSVSPGQIEFLPAPAIDVPIDLRVRPQSAEGGGFYGFSELTISATGNLTIEAAGFGCQAASCLYSPLPFVPGKVLVATAGDDLGGEFLSNEDVLTFSVSGTSGYLVIAGGEYIDATGAGGDPGDIQTITAAPFVQVPEPGLLAMLAAGGLALAGLFISREPRALLFREPRALFREPRALLREPQALNGSA